MWWWWYHDTNPGRTTVTATDGRVVVHGVPQPRHCHHPSLFGIQCDPYECTWIRSWGWDDSVVVLTTINANGKGGVFDRDRGGWRDRVPIVMRRREKSDGSLDDVSPSSSSSSCSNQTWWWWYRMPWFVGSA